MWSQRLNPLMLHKKRVSAPPSIHPPVQHRDSCSSHRDRCRKTRRTRSPLLLKTNRATAPYGAVPDAEQPKKTRGLAILHFGQHSPKAQRFISSLGSQEMQGIGLEQGTCHVTVTHPKAVGKSRGTGLVPAQATTTTFQRCFQLHHAHP